MTVRLNWPPEVVDRLRKEASARGLSVGDYILKVLLPKAPSDCERTPRGADQQTREGAVQSIRELRKGNILGPDTAIRDLIEEGRRF